MLDLRNLTIDDDFFELGGNSLLAIRLVNKVRRTMGVEMGIQEVFRTPTVAALAATKANAAIEVSVRRRK